MRSLLLLLTIFATGTDGSTMCQVNYNSTVTISDGTNMKVTFALCKGWPKDGDLTIVPPGGYSISGDATASGSVTGGLSVLVDDGSITIRRDGSGDDIEANSDGHAVEIEITGVIEAPVPMAPYRGNFTDFTRSIIRQLVTPPTPTGNTTHAHVHWYLDWSNSGSCTKEDGDVTIAHGVGGAKGVQVATCTPKDNAGNTNGAIQTLSCKVDSTNATTGTTLQADWLAKDMQDGVGPAVTSGCSVITISGTEYPKAGKCCFK